LIRGRRALLARAFAALLLAACCTPPAFAQPVVRSGARRLTIGAAGFEPATLRARVGELLRITVLATSGEHCFSLPTAAIEKRLRPGKAVNVEVSFEAAGTYPFGCCVDPGSAESGQVVVSE
jgi:plastocyanin